jgi:hypothetical protein
VLYGLCRERTKTLLATVTYAFITRLAGWDRRGDRGPLDAGPSRRDHLEAGSEDEPPDGWRSNEPASNARGGAMRTCTPVRLAAGRAGAVVRVPRARDDRGVARTNRA